MGFEIKRTHKYVLNLTVSKVVTEQQVPDQYSRGQASAASVPPPKSTTTEVTRIVQSATSIRQVLDMATGLIALIPTEEE